MLTIRAEFRVELPKRFGLAAFFGAGEVATDIALSTMTIRIRVAVRGSETHWRRKTTPICKLITLLDCKEGIVHGRY